MDHTPNIKIIYWNASYSSLGQTKKNPGKKYMFQIIEVWIARKKTLKLNIIAILDQCIIMYIYREMNGKKILKFKWKKLQFFMTKKFLVKNSQQWPRTRMSHTHTHSICTCYYWEIFFQTITMVWQFFFTSSSSLSLSMLYYITWTFFFVFNTRWSYWKWSDFCFPPS